MVPTEPDHMLLRIVTKMYIITHLKCKCKFRYRALNSSSFSQDTMSKIQVSAKMKIPNGLLEDFKQQIAECITKVREMDVGTLQYDWFLSSDKTECEFREGYESSEAALVHQSNLREPLRLLFGKFGSPHSMVFYGDPSSELLENAKKAGLDITKFSFFQGL